MVGLEIAPKRVFFGGLVGKNNYVSWCKMTQSETLLMINLQGTKKKDDRQGRMPVICRRRKDISFVSPN
jgi:hypothetical protein